MYLYLDMMVSKSSMYLYLDMIVSRAWSDFRFAYILKEFHILTKNHDISRLLRLFLTPNITSSVL